MRIIIFVIVAKRPNVIFGTWSGEASSNNHDAYPLVYIVSWIIKSNIKWGLFNNRAGRKIATKVGVHPDFSADMRRLLYGNGNSYIEYTVPELRTKGRTVIYTVIVGNHDIVHEPILINHPRETVDFVLLTDNPNLTSKVWQIRHVTSEMDSITFARYLRMHPHRYLADYDTCIYVDGSVFIYGDIACLAGLVSDTVPFVVTKHPERNTVREEFLAVASRVHLSNDEAIRLYKGYLAEGFSDNIGLGETTMLVIRNNNPKLMQMLDCWFELFQQSKARRDQLVLPVAINRMNYTEYRFIPGSVWCNQFFMVLPHNTRHR